MSRVGSEIQAVAGTVSGRVQGVGFRWFVAQHAARLGLAGWVRNTASGNVELHVQGSGGAVEEMKRLLAVGPRAARVSGIVFHTVEPDPRLDGFEIR